MLDEMSIKKYLSWDGMKFRGYSDLGDAMEPDDEGLLAREALFFMVVSPNAGYKVPVGFFLLAGMSGGKKLI